ncbi:MAG TPA: glycosyltransferase, partial [Bryobacteraceae bacterium]|nr:glycosyltransferase [Bryobacteraceae bacterium]
SSLGGGQSCLLDLLPGFHERGWPVQVALPDEGPFRDKLRGLGVPTHALNCKSYSSTYKSIRESFDYALELPRLVTMLARICRSENIELLYVNGPRLLPVAACVARFLKSDLVFHCHHRITQNSAVRLAGEALRLSRARVFACCNFAADPLRPYASPHSLHIVYNGVAEMPVCLSAFRPTIRRIGVIGRIEPEKGQLEFVKAARAVSRQFPDCTFSVTGAPLFSGGGYLQQVIHESCGLPIEFNGWQDDISSILASLDLLVVPSVQFDATPRVILEAFSAGVPVLGFPTGGISEIIENGHTGFLTAEATPAALAASIVQISNLHPDTLAGVIAHARLSWEQKFNLNLFQQRICSLLASSSESVTARKPDRTRRDSIYKRPGVNTKSETSAVLRQS